MYNLRRGCFHDDIASMKVFKKETRTDQYMNFSTNHPLDHKREVVRMLMNKAGRLVSGVSELRTEGEST